MFPSPRRSHTSHETSRRIAAIATAVVSADLPTIADLRLSPGTVDSPAIPARFLLQADEQTVVGFSAVLKALAGMRKTASEFRDWGAIGAPRFAGRGVGATTLPKFRSGGAAVISPHFIPQLSLHSLSGAISVGLGMRGPNFGVGGGPNNVAEGLLAALAIFETTGAPGLWLIATEWSPELVVNSQGEPLGPAGELPGPAPICHAAAIALVRDEAAGVPLRVVRDESPRMRIASETPDSPETLSVVELARLLSIPEVRVSNRLPAFGGWSFEIGASTERERLAA